MYSIEWLCYNLKVDNIPLASIQLNGYANNLQVDTYPTAMYSIEWHMLIICKWTHIPLAMYSVEWL